MSLNFSQVESEVVLITDEPLPVASQNSQKHTLSRLSELERETLIMTTARVILFLGNNHMPLDKKKVVDVAMKQYMANHDTAKPPLVTNAVFSEASQRVHDIYGYVVRRAPIDKMDLAKKYEERYYLINPIRDTSGVHSKAIHINIHSGAK